MRSTKPPSKNRKAVSNPRGKVLYSFSEEFAEISGDNRTVLEKTVELRENRLFCKFFRPYSNVLICRTKISSKNGFAMSIFLTNFFEFVQKIFRLEFIWAKIVAATSTRLCQEPQKMDILLGNFFVSGTSELFMCAYFRQFSKQRKV